MQKNTSTYHVHSLAKGLQILETLGQVAMPLTLSEISQRLGLSSSTTYRFLHTLEGLGFLERMPDKRAYRLTPKVLALGYSAFASSDLWQKAHPYLLAASEEYGETFNLSILDNTEILYIDRVKTKRILSMDLEIGSKLPAYCTSMGRVLLAHIPEERAVELLKRSRLIQYTQKTVVEIPKLLSILEQVRIKGYAINDGELALELRSVAAPIKDRDGKVVAAINMAVRASEYSLEKMENELSKIVMGLANKISQSLGYLGA